MRHLTRIIACVAIVLAGCNDATAPEPANLLSAARYAECVGGDDDEWRAEDWRRDCPFSVGMDSARLRLAIEAMDATPDVRAFIIVKDARVVLEAYRSDADATHAFHQQSATKSVTSALVGIAIGRNDLAGTATTLAETIPQHLRPTDHPSVPGITIAHLLSMSSGLSGPPAGAPPLMRQLLARPVVRTPGTAFEYDDGGYHLLSAVLRVATGEDARAYASRHLFAPLGIRVDADEWARDDLRNPFGSTGLRLSAREMVKLGLLYLNDGVWRGERVLPEGWVAASTTPRALDGLPSGGLDYGLGWWLTSYGGHEAWFAAGHGGQTITVVPGLRLVVVIAANPQSAGEWQRFRLVIPEHVIPSIADGLRRRTTSPRRPERTRAAARA